MSADTSHLVKFDIHVLRSWHPCYYLTGGRACPDPVPPFDVRIAVESDDNDSALDFGRRVREILEEMS